MGRTFWYAVGSTKDDFQAINNIERKPLAKESPMSTTSGRAVIVGAGSGVSASLARALHARAWRVALVARDVAKLAPLIAATGALAISADASSPADMDRAFAQIDAEFGSLDLAVYNAGLRGRGPIAELDPQEVERALMAGAYGGFLMARAAARRMIAQGKGAIFFTGASASIKGFAQSAPFAMAKFALRGLAQSAARELQPKGIHVAHFVIDGGVRSAERGRVEGPDQAPDSLLDPDAIAATYLSVLDQPRSAWSTEVELRPWVEKF
jgi:NAD(P)-dependent dehydrogenase (short-subunit alcohol dehydrogenase family)